MAGGLIAGVLLVLGAAGSPATTMPPVGWSQGAPLPAEFPPRWDFAYAQFPARNQVVMFGGAPVVAGQSWRNDTWIYEGGQWHEGPAAPAGLTPRGGAAMAYHAGIGKIVMFGGSGGEWPPSDETWLYDGDAWTRGPAAPPGMAGRVGARMAYHEPSGKVVLFGGSGVTALNDTWLFDGTSWQPGPTSPGGPGPRVFFGMVYDPVAQNVLMAGGNGGADTWRFDGVSWTRDADLPAGVAGVERLNLAYNPQLGGTMLFGGIGAGPKDAFWLLRNGGWTSVPKDQTQARPIGRLEGAVAWLPDQDAFMMFAGIQDDGKDESSGFADTWFFRDVPPQVDSVAVGPQSPVMTTTLTLTAGPATGGYKTRLYEYAWFKNGVKVVGAKTVKLTPELGLYRHGDELQAKVRLHDVLGIYGPWVSSNVVTVLNRPPLLTRATFGPGIAYDITDFTASPTGTDPDGDPVTFHYAWTVNGVPVPDNDIPTLSHDHYKAGDQIGLTTSINDSLGLAGNSIAATPVTVKKSLVVGTPNSPGKTIKFTVNGFRAGEIVEIRAGSKTGTRIGQAVATDGGYAKSFTIPSPFPGGTHKVYAVGVASGLVGPGTMKVLPSASISPPKVAAGESTLYSAVGFVPGETVSLSFPGGPVTTRIADANGSVSASLVSPPQAYPGGKVTGSAPSGSTASDFFTDDTFTSQSEGLPQLTTPIALTGFGPLETVKVTFDASPVGQTFVTDASGSLQANVLLNVTFGTHSMNVRGESSGITGVNMIHLQQSMTVSPGSGKAGSTVSIDSGPGWEPGATLKLQFKQGIVKNVIVDATGSVHTTYQIPSTQAPGVCPFKLISDTLGLSASANFTVTS